MHRHSKTLALLLAAVLLCFSLTSCKETASDSSDICQKIAGIPADTVFLTIDGREITAEEYLYWACLILDSYYYNNVIGTDADDDTCSWVSGSWGSSLSSTVLGYLLNYNAPIIHAEDVGFSVDEEEINDIVETTVSEYRANCADNETFELYLSQICMSPEGFRHIMEENAYYQLLLDYLYYNGGEYSPSDEDIRSFADDNGYYACKYVFFSTVGCYTDAAIEGVRDKAQLLLDNLAAVDDPDAYFSTVITNSNWNDDTDESEDGLLSAGGTISTVFDEAVRSLEIGEFSGIVDNTDEYGYFVIQRLDIQPDELRDVCCAYLFNQLLNEWNIDADVEFTDAYADFDFQNFYVSLINYRLSTDVDGDTNSDADNNTDSDTDAGTDAGTDTTE